MAHWLLLIVPFVISVVVHSSRVCTHCLTQLFQQRRLQDWRDAALPNHPEPTVFEEEWNSSWITVLRSFSRLIDERKSVDMTAHGTGLCIHVPVVVVVWCVCFAAAVF